MTDNPGRRKTRERQIASAGVPASNREDAVAGRSELPEGGDLFRLLVESVRDYAIFALDAQGSVLTWNPGAERMKGWKPAEIIGKHFSVFYLPEDVESREPDQHLLTAAAEGRTEYEGWRLRRDGSRFWANVVLTALRTPEGKVVGFAKLTRDVTDRRTAELALRESEERFRTLVQSVTDYGIFLLDPGGHIVSWNEGAERIEGYTAEEIIGRHFSVFYPPEDVAWGKPQWELETALRDGRLEDEGWRLRKDGTRFWANVVITPLSADQGDIRGFAKVTRDLTERRLAEQRALEDARRVAEAEAANRAKTEFLASLSHELRTPLNAIGGYTDLIIHGVRGPVTDQQRADLERIRRSQQHLLGIISDLLNFSRIESGNIQYHIAAVPIAVIIDEVRAIIEPIALAKGIELSRGACQPRVMALADQTKLQQIVLNLLSNAVKFTLPGGRVIVDCTQVGDRVHLHVTDTGPGIPESKQTAIFEPFTQIGRSLSTPREGAGLGLTISRDLARAMHGDLTVKSAVGKGSTFTVVLPAARIRN